MHIYSPEKFTRFQNVIPPSEWEKLGLYLKTNSTRNWRLGEFPELGPGEFLSTEAYFNQLIEAVPANLFGKSSIFLQIDIIGSGKLSLFRNCEDHHDLIAIHLLSEGLHQIEIPLKSEKLGGIIFELEGQSEICQLKSASWLVNSPEPKKTIAAIICTFKREKEIQKNLRKIQESSYLKDIDVSIFVVDHGDTLRAESFSKGPHQVQLFHQKNLGGSGGFGRGLLEAQSQNSDFFLFMDDDIQLEPEMIFRTYHGLALSQKPICIAGSMLDAIDIGELYESGAWVGKGNPLIVKSRFTGFDVLQNKTLLSLNHPDHLLTSSDFYGAWWFWAFPKEVPEKCGLPQPLFIKFDDIDYGIRASRAGFPTVAPGNIGVHHEPFYAKDGASWPNYYFARNALVFSSVQREDSALSVLSGFWKSWIHVVVVFRYDQGLALIEALKDFLKGPEFLIEQTKEHAKKAALFTNPGLPSQISPEDMRVGMEPRESLTLGSLARLLTFNGNLIPLKNPGKQFFFKRDLKWSRVKTPQLLVLNPLTNHWLLYKINRPLFRSQLKQLLMLSFHFFIKWGAMKRQYRLSQQIWCKQGFWRDYVQSPRIMGQPKESP